MMNASDSRESIPGEFAPSAPLQVSRIAIADDDPDSLALLRLALRSPVTEICEATNGVELVQLLLENAPFDLVVTDLLMPWIEGLAVLRSARVAEDMTPVLLITGLRRPDLDATVERLGHAKLLHKPFGISELRAAVHELMIGQRLS